MSDLNDPTRLILLQQYREGHTRYVYFLLAVAASAIGFAVQKTTGSPLLPSQQWALGIAVLCWGASFVAGCMNVDYSQIHIAANLAHLDDIKQARRKYPVSLEELGLDKYPEESNLFKGKTISAKKWQFRFLIAGFVMFLVWHVLEMSAITADLSASHTG